jgi:hypothetical protein
LRHAITAMFCNCVHQIQPGGSSSTLRAAKA